MSFHKQELRSLCQTATTAAIAAGQYIQSQVHRFHDKHYKEGGFSLASQVVTDVDLQAQKIILRHLQSSIHKHDLGLLTEEAVDDQSRLEKAYFWCIDPIDGTLPYTEERTGYAVSIALVSRSGDPLIGVVYVPDLQQCYVSIQGEGVLLNHQAFLRDEAMHSDILHVFMDSSLKADSSFIPIQSQLSRWAKQQNLVEVQYHAGFGAVRNALGVMTSGLGCYFKFPKQHPGGGSIWDYAATRLFFEELGLVVSDAKGSKLHLNDDNHTFMNDAGIRYATDAGLSEFIGRFGVAGIKP